MKRVSVHTPTIVMNKKPRMLRQTNARNHGRLRSYTRIATIRKFFETSENVSNLIYLTIAYAGKVQV